jgi:hypothetical protein
MNNLSPQVVEHTIYHNICQESSWYANLGLYDNEEPLRVYRIKAGCPGNASTITLL